MYELLALHLGDRAEPWEALGFTVIDGLIALDRLALHVNQPGAGIVGWTVTGIEDDIDGLAPMPADPPSRATDHPNGALALDHVVVVTSDFDRTTTQFETAGLALKRFASRDGRRQGFRRLGPPILEVVEAPEAPPGPARFWGLTMTVADLDALAARLGDRLGRVKAAVQPGRRIATLRTSTGLGPAVAFMDPPAAHRGSPKL